MKQVDALIVGGGPAGLATALRLHEKGIREILVVEREKTLGGILRQCIHDGFGLTRFGESLTGPEYAERFITPVHHAGICCMTDSMVTDITAERVVTIVSRTGVLQIKCRAIILSMGCRERTRGALAIPGERPAGIYTAGVAQAYMNLYYRMPAREVVILGSGDIGMIMARRLTLEGAHVQAVYEIMPYPNGLPRNIVQCLEDYDIPLVLSHTVTSIHGDRRLCGVTISEVDEHLRPIPGTETYHACDTLILSAGLIPENELSIEAGVRLDPVTRGAEVDEHAQTSVPGIFAAGNVLHVHDLADYVSREAERTANAVARYLDGMGLPPGKLPVLRGKGIRYTVPQRITGEESFILSLRVSEPMQDATISVCQNGRTISEKKLIKALPAEMILLEVNPERDGGEIEVSMRGQKMNENR